MPIDLIPILTKERYKCSPSIMELSRYTASELRKVEHFKIFIEVLLNNVIDENRGLCNLFFNENWNVIKRDDNYGLDIEASWLILDASQILGEKKILIKLSI